jgi:integrase
MSHSLRSGAATAVVEAGGSLDDARQLLNHKSDTAAAHYAKSAANKRRQRASTMLALPKP